MIPLRSHKKSKTASDAQPGRSQIGGMESAWAYRMVWEQCERRLALSAMPWMPWELAQPDVYLHEANGAGNACPAMEPGPTSAIEPFLSEAHGQTGWNHAQSQWGLTGKGQTVAVIDSGIAFDHVALGKGYGPGYRVVGGWDFAENDARPYDDAPAGFHGTHVSGIIGANDGLHSGVAPNVDLVALRVFNDAGKGELAWTENALKWVHEHRNSFANSITTVNLSLGSAWNASSVPSWGTLEDELAQLQRDGIVVVASAGNSFQQYKAPGLAYPAASPYVIPVLSIDSNGQLSDFSQRDSRSIGAPGRSIESSVPDYFYGKDGIHNDWATSSGTSMAAPYISGASVLVREAMELVGLQNITPQSIYEHLKSTSNSVWDNITKQNYQSLDLDRAIESLLPVDTVGDSLATGLVTSIQKSWQTDGWINALSDHDVYRLLPTESGTVSVQLTSDAIDDGVFSIFRGGQESRLQATSGRLTFSVLAGESIGLAIADSDSIGPYRLNWSFADSSTGGGTAPAVPNNVVDLGSIDLFEQSLLGTSRYKLTAENTGILSVVVDAGSLTSGALQVLRPGMANGTLVDSTLESNQWRIDLNVIEGQSIEFALPSASANHVQLVNLVQTTGHMTTIHGTDASDNYRIDLSDGIVAQVGGIVYRLDSNTKTIALDGDINNDSLIVAGSLLTETVELKPGLATLDSLQLNLKATGFENVQFLGGGGQDRAYLHDAATDDRLNIWPNKAELTGIGYGFSLDQVERIFVHAIQGGDDQAFVFDSDADDTLSVRPQFTSLRAENYFNYVAGFERVFAYASAGGIDKATLYDSVANDVFNTNSNGSSIVGPGFSTFANGFENVEAFSNAGGQDRANMAVSSGGRLISGADYVGTQEASHTSIARGFERIESYVAGQSVSLQSQAAPTSLAQDAFDLDLTSTHESPFPNMDSNEARENRNDWIQHTVRDQQSDPWTFASPMDRQHRNETIANLDLSWTDSTNERAALDEIFSKQS